MDRIRRHARSEQCKRGFEQAAISTGSLFPSINRHGQVQEPGRLSGIDMARIVKKLGSRAGLDATKYAGHSLRAGPATSAAIAGASETCGTTLACLCFGIDTF
jgi:hypothetical protein